MKLTVIIPTFNRCQLLSEAINSLLCQSPKINEIVIVDDASSDDTQNLCQKFQRDTLSSDTNIIFARNETNLGAQVCRNRGLDLSTGDAVLFMDSDDVIVKRGIQPLLQALDSDRNLDYVYGQVLKTDSELQPLENYRPVGSSFSSESSDIAGYHWHTMGAIYRREYLRKVGYWNETLTGSQDWEFQARAKLAGGKGKFVEHIIGLWRNHSGTRVGTKKFRHDYVESVIRACLLIRDKSKDMGKLDVSLEQRLSKKIIFHAMEFAVNGYRIERSESLFYAIDTLQNSPVMQMTVRCWRILSHHFDFVLWKIICLNYKVKTIGKL